MAGAKEEPDEVESRESDRVMATETRAGVMLDVGDVKYIVDSCVSVAGRACMRQRLTVATGSCM